MRRSLNRLLLAIGILIVPIGGALYYRQTSLLGLSVREGVETTAAAVIGMIPEGPIPDGQPGSGRQRPAPGHEGNAGTGLKMHGDPGPRGRPVCGQDRHHHPAGDGLLRPAPPDHGAGRDRDRSTPVRLRLQHGPGQRDHGRPCKRPSNGRTIARPSRSWAFRRRRNTAPWRTAGRAATFWVPRSLFGASGYVPYRSLAEEAMADGSRVLLFAACLPGPEGAASPTPARWPSCA